MTKPSGASAVKCRTLFLSPEPPYPMIGGGPIRSASIFEYLARHSTVDVITFRQPGDPDPRERFPSGQAHSIFVVDLPLHSKSAPARAFRNLARTARGIPPLTDRFAGFENEIGKAVAGRQYDFGVIEHFWCAQYEPVLRNHCRRLYLDLHNIESQWHATLAVSENPALALLHGRFANASRKLENALLPRFDGLLVTSAADAERALALAPAAQCVIYPNALPYTQQPDKSERDVIVFSGNLEYQPNISGIQYFRNEIWPSVRKRCPGLMWEIIGKNPHAIAELVRDDERIQIIGPVADAIAYIAGAKASIVPLLAGSGTRIKILEAWAAATPVIATPLGAEGLDYVSGENILIARDPSGFSDAIVSLMQDPLKRAEIGRAGRKQYEEKYTWRTAHAVLNRNVTCL